MVLPAVGRLWPSDDNDDGDDDDGDGEEMYLQGAAIWHPRSDLVEEEDGNSDEDDVGPV